MYLHKSLVGTNLFNALSDVLNKLMLQIVLSNNISLFADESILYVLEPVEPIN